MTKKIIRLRTIFPNLSGFLAIILWATGATSLCFIKSIPSFQLLAMVFLGVFLFSIGKLFYTKKWASLKMPWTHWGLVFLGLPLQQFLYVLAYQNCPPEEVDILIYTWPLMALFFMVVGFKRTLNRYQVFSAFLGFMAVLTVSLNHSSGGLEFGMGHALALLTAVAWGLFTVLSRKGPKVTAENIGISYGVGFMIALAAHLQFETTQFPNVSESISIVYYTVCIATLPFILWTYSTQRGNIILLSTSAYFKPLLSILLLISMGYAEYSTPIILAGTFVITAGFLSNTTFTDFLESQVGPVFSASLERTYALVSRS